MGTCTHAQRGPGVPPEGMQALRTAGGEEGKRDPETWTSDLPTHALPLPAPCMHSCGWLHAHHTICAHLMRGLQQPLLPPSAVVPAREPSAQELEGAHRPRIHNLFWS